MKYGCDSLSYPIEQLFETQPLQPERHGRSASLRQQRGVNPYPQIAQEQGDGHEHQAQMRIARAGVNPCLPQLPETRFDAKTFAVAFADLRRTAVDPPGREQKFLLPPLARFAVAVAAVRDAHRYLRR